MYSHQSLLLFRWFVKAVHAYVSLRQSARPERHVEHDINLAYVCIFPVLLWPQGERWITITLHRRSGKSHPSSSVFPPKPPLGDFDVVQLLRDVAHLDQHANWQQMPTQTRTHVIQRALAGQALIIKSFLTVQTHKSAFRCLKISLITWDRRVICSHTTAPGIRHSTLAGASIFK